LAEKLHHDKKFLTNTKCFWGTRSRSHRN